MDLDQAWIEEEEAKKEKRIRAWLKWCKRIPDDAFIDADVTEDTTGKVPWLGYHDFISIGGGVSSLNMDTEDEIAENRKEYNREYMRKRRRDEQRRKRNEIYSKRNNVSSRKDE